MIVIKQDSSMGAGSCCSLSRKNKNVLTSVFLLAFALTSVRFQSQTIGKIGNSHDNTILPKQQQKKVATTTGQRINQAFSNLMEFNRSKLEINISPNCIFKFDIRRFCRCTLLMSNHWSFLRILAIGPSRISKSETAIPLN